MCALQKTYPVCLGIAAAIAVTALDPAHTAQAQPAQPGLRIERLDASPSIIDGYAQLTFHATAVTLQGAFMSDITGKNAWALTIGKKTEKLPYIAGQFHALPDEIAIGIVIDTSPEFAPVLDNIQQQVSALIEALPKKRAQVALIGFDTEVRGSKRVLSVSRAIDALGRLYADTDPGDKLLLDAVKRAHRAVERAEPLTEGTNIRRLLVVISDGRDASYPNPADYRKIARRAGRDGIPIHTIGFAPDGNRLPLRGLGELTKHAGGTFRFAYTKSGFKSHFDQLLAEINGRYTVTFFVPEKDIKNKKVGLLATARDLASTEQTRLNRLACGDDSCDSGYCVEDKCVARNLDEGRGVLGWILLIVGIIVGVLVALVLISLILARISAARQARPAPELAGDDDPAGSAHFGAQHSGHMPAAGSNYQMPAAGGPQRIQPSGAHPAAHAGAQRIMPSGSHPPVAHRPPSMNQAQAGRPSLLVIDGPLKGQRIPLFNGFTIGKAPDCHLTLAGDNFASGHHARIVVDTRGTCTLTDLGSTNGTFINGNRMLGQTQLQHGMLVGIGATKARFLAR